MNQDETGIESAGEVGSTTAGTADGFEMFQHDLEQPALFPLDELVIPPSVSTLKKAVSAIHSVPSKSDKLLEINHRRLFDACILVAQLQFRNWGRAQFLRIIQERISPMFEVSTRELARLGGVGHGQNYQRIYDDLDDLYNMSFEWNILREDANVEWKMKARFLTALGKGQGEKTGMVRFAFDPSVLEIVLEPKNWAMLSASVHKGLKKSASYALFQNTWRYINTNQKITAALATETWVALLVGKSRYVKETEDGKTAINYGDFKRRVLLPAMGQVNDMAALSHTLELIEHKKNLQVTRIQFKFIPKTNQLKIEYPQTWPTDVLTLLERIGFSRQEIHDLGESYTFQEVADALSRLEVAQRKLKSKNKKITSIKAYFLGILAKINAGVSSDEEIDDEEVRLKAERIESERKAEERRERYEREFARHQYRVVKEWVQAQPEATQMMLWEGARSSQSVKALADTVKAGVESGLAVKILLDWMHEHQPELWEQALSNAQDRTLEGWMVWQLDAGGAVV